MYTKEFEFQQNRVLLSLTRTAVFDDKTSSLVLFEHEQPWKDICQWYTVSTAKVIVLLKPIIHIKEKLLNFCSKCKSMHNFNWNNAINDVEVSWNNWLEMKWMGDIRWIFIYKDSVYQQHINIRKLWHEILISYCSFMNCTFFVICFVFHSLKEFLFFSFLSFPNFSFTIWSNGTK